MTNTFLKRRGGGGGGDEETDREASLSVERRGGRRNTGYQWVTFMHTHTPRHTHTLTHVLRRGVLLVWWCVCRFRLERPTAAATVWTRAPLDRLRLLGSEMATPRGGSVKLNETKRVSLVSFWRRDCSEIVDCHPAVSRWGKTLNEEPWWIWWGGKKMWNSLVWCWWKSSCSVSQLSSSSSCENLKWSHKIQIKKWQRCARLWSKQALWMKRRREGRCWWIPKPELIFCNIILQILM